MSQSLADALHHYSPADHYDQLGKAENCYSNATYLAYNDNDGWYTVELNIFCRIIRYLFGAFRDTHLNHIAHRLSFEGALPAGLQARMEGAWRQTYPQANSHFNQAPPGMQEEPARNNPPGLRPIQVTGGMQLEPRIIYRPVRDRGILKIKYTDETNPLTRDQIESIARQYPNTSVLSIEPESGSYSAANRNLFQNENDVTVFLNNQNLKALSIKGYFEGICFLRAAAQSIHSNLEHIEIPCSSINAEVLQAIGEVAPGLRGLRILIDEEQTNPAAIAALLQTCPELKRLNLFNSQLSDAMLTAIASAKPDLEGFEVCFCPNITNRGIFAFGPQSGLKVLNLQNCAGLDCAVIEHLMRITTLEELDIRGITPITASDLRRLLNQCPNLVRIQSTADLTPAEVIELKQDFTNRGGFHFSWATGNSIIN